MNLAIIGCRGTGKTSVSKLLSDELDMKLVSTDKLIIEKAGMLIPNLVEKHGWKRFRDYEQEIIKELSTFDNCIIDCGGGVVERNINIKLLKKSSKIILLTANIKTIVRRIEGTTDRPPLTSNKTLIKEVTEVLKKRKERYNQSADYMIDTTNLTIQGVVEEIKAHLK